MFKRNILVIDDDNIVRKSIEKLLKHEGYQTVTAGSAKEGLDKIKNGDFDLIISDIRMPGMNGVEAIRETRRLLSEMGKGDMPVIFITGYADMSAEFDAQKLGEVILKPFDLERLLVAVRDYL